MMFSRAPLFFINIHMTYVAFLRGINVGGNKIVKMADLKKMLEAMGFTNVKTLLASGNIVFETPQKDVTVLTKVISAQLEKTFGFEIAVMLRSREEIQKLVDSAPFKNIAVTKETRLYVTFLSEKSTTGLKIPYSSPDGNFIIVRATATEVCSVLTISPRAQTTDLMKILEKEFGKNVTTRNWNTVLKLLS